jgi:hypothetical protein
MQQETLASEASVEGLDREMEQESSLEGMQQVGSGMEQGDSKLSDARRLAWLGVKLCNSLLHRWFNICEVGVEEIFYALLMPHFFAEVELAPVTASQEKAGFSSHRLLGENDFLRPAESSESSGDRPESAISWRTPWLYLVLLLLVWLLLF